MTLTTATLILLALITIAAVISDIRSRPISGTGSPAPASNLPESDTHTGHATITTR